MVLHENSKGPVLTNKLQPVENVAAAAQKLTMASGASATGAGLWAWMGEHHQEIGALCAMIGAAFAGIGLIVTVVLGIRRDIRERRGK